MTTRTGSRIYRGAPRPLPAGACPHCGRTDVGTTDEGRRKTHADHDGAECTGSRILITDEAPPVEVDPDAVVEAWADPGGPSRWAGRDRSKLANPWSGKP